MSFFKYVFDLDSDPNFSKAPAQTAKLKALQKLILSFFLNILHLIDQLTVSETLVLALNESAKLIPYITSSRKTVKTYQKVRERKRSSCGCLTIVTDMPQTVVERRR